MLSTNVLCMKKRKKRSYYISEASDYIPRPSKDKRSVADRPAMMQITEDTPPDMLAGAMDLTVHLPTGRTVKMSVERSTPMMDLLVQITTAHHLQHSGHILQALEMAPSSSQLDKILPYKPNTPIGALDTQHVKVIPKNRSIPVPKSVSVGHQPFESTFRLQVHLPRNQLYVIRVSQNVYLGDIMKKVCEEKNLDSLKYEFRHPGNLDEVLDPKLTLSDYQITEVYIVQKGTVGLTQAFSSSDIMALRKEEERKQLQARTGGGVFSLIFKRGKTSMGSGSLSSENRSISPSHSDDSRSVTPPAIQQQILAPISQEPSPQTEKPKAPQRKRRPAPKPPQQADNRKDSTDKPPSQISSVSDTNMSDFQQKKIDNGLTICHSRNSSDSSGYHEPSVLSDNCNTSLPRRPKSTIINEVVSEEVQSGEHSRSNGNLTKMATFSKSSTSIASRKKKAAPPPPAVLKSENSPTNAVKASPVAASPSIVEKQDNNQSKTDTTVAEPVPAGVVAISSPSANQIKTSPKPPPRNKVASEPPKPTPRVKPVVVEHPIPQARSFAESTQETQCTDAQDEEVTTNQVPTKTYNNQAVSLSSTNEKLIEQYEAKMEQPQLVDSINSTLVDASVPDNLNIDIVHKQIAETDESADVGETPTSCNYSDISEGSRKLPEIIAVIPKKAGSPTSLSSHSSFDTIGRKRGFNIGTSMLSMNDDEESRSVTSFTNTSQQNSDTVSLTSKNSYYNSNTEEDYEMSDLDIDIFNASLSKKSKNSKKILHELHGMHDLELQHELPEVSSLRSSESMPTFLEQSNIKKWNNMQELDHISMASDNTGFGSRWVVGDNSDTDSAFTAHTKESPCESISSSKRSSLNPSRQDSKTNIILENKVLPKESPVESVNSSKQSSCVSSRKESRSSIAAEKIETELNPTTQTTPNQTETSSNTKSNPQVSFLPPTSTKVHDVYEVDQGGLKPEAHVELAELENDWQYQLPSPPTAFRDSSPTNMTDVTNYDTITLEDFKDESVVTSPELFEKLRIVKESQCDTETISDFNSVVSDEEKPMFSKLTLENLEKRKSLVYNRELSTSLKIAQENVSSSSNVNNKRVEEVISKRSSVLSELEGVIQNGSNRSLSRHNSCATEAVVKPVIDSNLPNFKISTYDKPKSKINIFEDDSIRSNVDNNAFKATSSIDLTSTDDMKTNENINYSTEMPFFTTKNSLVGRSMENIAYRKHSLENPSDDDLFKKPQEFNKFKSTSRSNFFNKHLPDTLNNVTRSESFSSNHNVPGWKPQNPVQRSKSQVALNKYRDEQESKVENEDGLSKSNSLFDVSGLQSLEVIRMIQTKLNTPNNSTEQLLEQESSQTQTTSARSSISLDLSSPLPPSKAEPESTTNTKTYRYQGPPAINLSTWSERPKTKVSLKEDTDYRINSKDNFNSKFNLRAPANNRNGTDIGYYTNGSGIHSSNSTDSNHVSIKINGTEPITTQESGNVVIKIGESQPSKGMNEFSTRFINHTTAVGYRKPLANVNKIEKAPRPHSIAFDSDFDISRVPIVRSVELKKPFRETPSTNNTSVTQINSFNSESTNNARNKYTDLYHSTESVNEINGLKPQIKNSSVYLSSESVNKPVYRVNSFAQNRTIPVVMGFKNADGLNDNTARSRKSWNVPSYNTLPLKTNPEPPVKSSVYMPNSNVPFSHVTLKRIESNKPPSNANLNNNNNSNNIFGKVVLRNTSAHIRANNNNRNLTGSQSGIVDNESLKRYSNGTETRQGPPPPPLMPKVTGVTKKFNKNLEPSPDSRGELLNSIRNFGGTKGLRHVKA